MEWRSAELGRTDVWLLGERQMLASAFSEDGDENADGAAAVFGVNRFDCDDDDVFSEKLPLGVAAVDGGAVDAA